MSGFCEGCVVFMTLGYPCAAAAYGHAFAEPGDFLCIRAYV